MLAGREGRLGDLAMQVRRQRDIHDLDALVTDDVEEVIRGLGDSESVGRSLGGPERSRRDAHDLPAHRAIGGQVAFAHDLAGTDDADAIGP